MGVDKVEHVFMRSRYLRTMLYARRWGGEGTKSREGGPKSRIVADRGSEERLMGLAESGGPVYVRRCAC